MGEMQSFYLAQLLFLAVMGIAVWQRRRKAAAEKSASSAGSILGL
ncbi:MAG: hypothetical protein NUV78_01095 [Candidatus Zambryskibacteria bacterium]|nr:hypothetical protein [Candidatus Zambryskibacteria bacterium]